MTTQDFKTSTIPSASFGHVKDSIRVVADRVEVIDQKVEAIDYGLRYVPARVGEIETNIHANNKNMEEIKWRNDVHSAKIKSMQQEMEEMRLQNEGLRHQMHEFRNTAMYKESPRGDHYPGSPRRDVRDGYQQDRSPRGDYYQGRDTGGQVQSQPKRDEISDPKEHAVHYENNEFSRMAGYHGPNQKTVGDYKTSYKSHFVEPKTLMQKPGSKNPRNCGGYVFLRFSDSDFMEVCVAVTRLKGMLMSHNGKIVGIARKNDIKILKNNGTGWDTSKYKSQRDPGYQTRREEPVTDTNKSLLVFWFASYEDALNLMNASHGNPFFQRDFPRPDGYQAFYVPLREPDIDAGFPTFLLTEYPNPSKDPVVTKIEADSRQIIERELPGECQPYLVSTEGGIRILRGDWMSPKSRILVSRFPTSSKVLDLFKKEAFMQNKQSLTHFLGNETTVLFTLTEFYCSDPYGQ